MVLGDAHGVRATQIRPPLLLSIEAIIGAGKSTLLEQLDSCNEIVVVREPVDLWEQQRGTETLLSRYYGDQKSNCFMFETYAMMSRVKALRDARSKISPETRAIVMERSWLSSRRCFGENSRELGHLDELEASLYEDLFQWGSETWPKLDGVIYINVDLEVAQGRVASRGRTAESGIPSDYQMALINKHRQWLYGEGSNAFDGPVLTLDGNQDKSNGALDTFMASVARFIDGLYTAPTTPPNGHRKQLSDGSPKVLQKSTKNDNEEENSGRELQLFDSLTLDEIVTPVKQKKPQPEVLH